MWRPNNLLAEADIPHRDNQLWNVALQLCVPSFLLSVSGCPNLAMVLLIQVVAAPDEYAQPMIPSALIAGREGVAPRLKLARARNHLSHQLHFDTLYANATKGVDIRKRFNPRWPFVCLARLSTTPGPSCSTSALGGY
eukprot:1925489-Amphidinium_carterae.1